MIKTIKNIIPRYILDSRGFPTVEVDLYTEDNMFRSSVPSGASKGIYEALELRDEDIHNFHGKGVLKAIDNINTIIKPRLLGLDVTHQEEIDKIMVHELDGTKSEYGYKLEKLGSNTVLAVSMAVCRAGAESKGMPLYKYINHLAGLNSKKFKIPIPSFNIINGGSHAGNKLFVQEFMIVPTEAENYKTALKKASEVYHTLKDIIKKKYGIGATNVGDEGGFAPNIEDPMLALELITEAIKLNKYENNFKISLDVAASEFYTNEELYNINYKCKNEPILKTKDDMIDLYVSMINKFSIFSIEDPFDQDDFDSYSKFMNNNNVKNKNLLVIGDDLLVTNPKRIEIAHKKKACSGLLLKLNQIGSVTYALKAFKKAKEYNMHVMVSHRSGETEDNFISDFAVGICAENIKSGAPCRSERTSKYNQLLRIEESNQSLENYGQIYLKNYS